MSSGNGGRKEEGERERVVRVASDFRATPFSSGERIDSLREIEKDREKV